MFVNKKVSVVTVAHNCSRFLTSAFKSFAYQDYENMEWIIVNDASTDTTAAKLQKYRQKDARVKLCLNTKRKGETDSYSFAISKATGDYIAFLEPHSFWVKNKISRQIGFMLRYDAVLSHTSYAFADGKYNLLPAGCCHVEPKVDLLNFGKDANICLSTFMLNREEIKDLFPIPEDKKNDGLIMYLMQKGLVSQGLTDVLALCRPKFDHPLQHKHTENVKKIYEHMDKNNIKIPNLMNYEVYKASNVINVKLDPSSCIGNDVVQSLNELKKFKL